MKSAHQIVQDFIKANDVDQAAFNEWFADAGHPEVEANVHDSRYLAHMEGYVAERNASLHGASHP